MHDKFSQAAISRVANGDHSNEAICQLLTCVLMCNQTTSERVQEVLQEIQIIKRNYEICPARQGHLPSDDGTKPTNTKSVHWSVLVKYGLWVLLTLLVLLAAALGVSLPFIN
ncbi:MAG: hypothetical protein IJV69_03970 [Kiritimatiellae bacterium]|nr:hypothetical protein [Kiritimatiellia bacterium]